LIARRALTSAIRLAARGYSSIWFVAGSSTDLNSRFVADLMGTGIVDIEAVIT
jgi:hypothetical protein